MRVIAGSAKGHNLKTPPGLNTRPTTDKVRGSIFSMLMNDICGRNALDLFAGSGALGIEALSRGAETCVFVDISRESVNVIKENLVHTKLLEKARVIGGNSLDFLKSCKSGFNLIFLDPPYHKGLARAALKIISEKNLLLPGGCVTVETDEDEEIDLDFLHYALIKEKKYGRISIKIYQNR